MTSRKAAMITKAKTSQTWVIGFAAG